jgi:hypothetical protein
VQVALSSRLLAGLALFKMLARALATLRPAQLVAHLFARLAAAEVMLISHSAAYCVPLLHAAARHILHVYAVIQDCL